MVGSNLSTSIEDRSSSNENEDWNNVEDWELEDMPPMEGVVSPALQETQISPTTSWDEGDEPWQTVGQMPTNRGVGAPRSPIDSLQPMRQIGDDEVEGQGESEGDDIWNDGTLQLAAPSIEGVLSHVVQGRLVDESFSWGNEEAWEGLDASSSRGLGRPRTDAERLNELRREGQSIEHVMPDPEVGGGWADIQGWIVDANPTPTPPPMEGVLSPSVNTQQALASTFNLGDGTQQTPSNTTTRGIGLPRTDAERLDLLVRNQSHMPLGIPTTSIDNDGWAQSKGLEMDPIELHRQIPKLEGVLATGPLENPRFAETYSWGDDEGDGGDWKPQIDVGVARGAGGPVSPNVRIQQEERLRVTSYEHEQQQVGAVAGDWAVNLPRGEAVKRGDEVEEWVRVMASNGPLRAIQPRHFLQPAIGVNTEKDSDATPSSFNTDKEFNLIKEISTRFLPDFASDENRALNITVQGAERALREVEDAIQEQIDRTVAMEDHMKRVQEEIAATQQRVEAKRREIATEEHLKTLGTFQARRLKREIVKMENEMHDMMERLQNFRAAILQGNDKLDQYRLLQNWNQGELDQWIQATLQKDEDLVALTSYTKHDTTRIKDLRLEEKQASGELTSLEDLLEVEMSETQSYQIQLDRTAEEFQRLHAERQKVIKMWEEAIELVHQRDANIHKATDEFASYKGALRNERCVLDNLDLKLYNAVERNKDLERGIFLKKLDAQRQRDVLGQEIEKCARTREELVLIKTNHLRAQHRFAKEVAKKIFFQEEIIRQKKMYKDARQKLRKMRKMVEDEYNHLDTLEKQTHALEKLLHNEELNLKLAKKEVAELQERHFKASEELFSLKAFEGDTIHEIKGGKSHAKTLVTKITVLEMDMLKKEEKLYAADFQIQLLERKVGRASGQRSNAEEIETTRQIKELESQLATVQLEEADVIAQLKRSHEELRASTQRKDELQKQNKKLYNKNAELNLECDAGLISNKVLIKDKEEIALEADLLHMEVNRLTALLHCKADEVFNLDSVTKAFKMNMDEQKAEVDGRQEIQRKEMKSISEELHVLMVKRQNLILKIDKLQCKYDCLRARMKSADGVEITAEFYLEKMVKEREEIQYKGAELQQEVQKAKVDVEFLEKAMVQIVQSNNNLRTSLVDSERKFELEEEAKRLKEDLGKSRDRTRFKEREERSLLQDLAEVEARVGGTEQECATATKMCEALETKIEIATKEESEQTTKHKRAVACLNQLIRKLRERCQPHGAADAKRLGGEFLLSELRESTKEVLYNLKQLSQDNPEYASVIQKRVIDEGFKLPSGPGSMRSSVSGSSSAGSVSSKDSRDSGLEKGKIAATSSVVKMEFKGP